MRKWPGDKWRSRLRLSSPPPSSPVISQLSVNEPSATRELRTFTEIWKYVRYFSFRHYLCVGVRALRAVAVSSRH